MILPVGLSYLEIAEGLGLSPDCVLLVESVPLAFVGNLPLHCDSVMVPLSDDEQLELGTEGAVLLSLPFLPVWPARVPPPWAWFGTIRMDRTVPDAYMFERRVLLVLCPAPTAPAG